MAIKGDFSRIWLIMIQSLYREILASVIIEQVFRNSFTLIVTLFCSVSNALQSKHGNWWWFVRVLWRRWILSVEYFAIRTTQWQAVSWPVTMMVVIWAIMFTLTFHFLELWLSVQYSNYAYKQLFESLTPVIFTFCFMSLSNQLIPYYKNS